MTLDPKPLQVACIRDAEVTATLAQAINIAKGCMIDDTVLCVVPKVLKPKLEQAFKTLLQTGAGPFDTHLWKKLHFKYVPSCLQSLFHLLIIRLCRYVLSSHSSSTARADASGSSSYAIGHRGTGPAFSAHEVLCGWNEAASSHTVALVLIGADLMCGQARQHSIEVDMGSLYHLLSLAHTVPRITSLLVSLALPARAEQVEGEAPLGLRALMELTQRLGGRAI